MDKNEFTKNVLEAEITMYRIAKSILIYDSDCEDAVQDAVLKAFSKLDTLREKRYFKTWLIRILINECYKKKKLQNKTLPFEEYALSQHCTDNNYSFLYNAIMQLKEKIRIVIVLHYIEGYSVEEVAKILKIPVGTVKSRLYSGRKLLKEELKDE
jgi:RNA polymerase sigma-70 factor (ECF subfamily)